MVFLSLSFIVIVCIYIYIYVLNLGLCIKPLTLDSKILNLGGKNVQAGAVKIVDDLTMG